MPSGNLASDGMSIDLTPDLPGPTPEPTEDQKVVAMLAYLLACFAGGFLAPLVILVVKRESKFVAFHAIQAALVSMAWLGIPIVTFFATAGPAITHSAHHPPGANRAWLPVESFLMVPILLLCFAGWTVTSVVLAVRAKGGHWSAAPGFGWLVRRLTDMVRR